MIKSLKRIFLLIFVGVVGIAMGLGGSMLWHKFERAAGERIGVVPLEGFIGDAGFTVGALGDFGDDDDIKAVILRVVSPGGVVAPSQEIYEEVRKLAETKPVVASFGAVAASGGYYISAPATKIVANPGSVTGSIGVILQFHDFHEVVEKIGVGTRVIKSGPYKDTGSPFRPMGGDEEQLLQDVVDDIHSQFVEAVAEGRGMSVEEVRRVADGRIFSGRMAHELGLVDELGTYEDAIALAGRLGGIVGEPKLEFAREEEGGLIDYLLGSEVSAALKTDPLTAPPIRYQLPSW